MKIIVLIPVFGMIIPYFIPSQELSYNSLMPYSKVGIDGDDDGIIAYGVKKIDAKYGIPDISISVKDCNESIAGKYIPSSKSIIICNDFIKYVKDTYKHLELDDYRKSVNGTILFILYHEFAHMFDDLYNLPIVGNDEIAADQFAALNLLEDGLLYNHLQAYKQLIDDAADIPAWDEHPSYKQQYYNLACMLYGYDSITYSNLKEELHDRAYRCYHEFNSISMGWSELLAQ